MERQDRRDAGLDGLLLVVRGHEDRDGWQGIALHQALEVLVLRQPGLLPDLRDRKHQQQRVEGVERQKIEQDGEVRVADELVHAANSASAWAESPSTRRAMSRALGSAPTSAASSAFRPAAPKRVRASPVRSRTHQSGSRSAACNSGSVAGSASMPSDRAAWARTGQRASPASRVNAAIDSGCGKAPTARATWVRTSASAWPASAVSDSRNAGSCSRAANSARRASAGSSVRRSRVSSSWTTTVRERRNIPAY